jgi:cytochrome c-type biogenesis protein CcmH/NrfG
MAAQQHLVTLRSTTHEEPLTERGSRGRGRGEEGAKAAEVELRRALALDPAHVSALHNLAVGLMGQVPPRPAGIEATEAGLDASGAAAFAEGEALLRQAFERSPRDPDVLVGLAEARPPQPRPPAASPAAASSPAA